MKVFPAVQFIMINSNRFFETHHEQSSQVTKPLAIQSVVSEYTKYVSWEIVYGKKRSRLYTRVVIIVLLYYIVLYLK